jgi:4-amino-4-deoxy-L-arabinose transferase-like glycosyltransferase
VGLDGDLPLAAGLLNVVLGSATIALVYVIGRRLAGPRIAIASSAIVAVFPGLILTTGAILTETLFNALPGAPPRIAVRG